ncbi:MAG: gluconokinase [Acidobacteria bacterium]|nr:gluconokinase [Acidobacteriota bacterium]
MQRDDTSKNLLVCAIDIGTSSIRVSAFNQNGQEVKNLFVQTFYQMEIDLIGKVEISVEELFTKTIKSIDQFLNKVAKENYLLIGVGLSTIWHSLVAIDSKANALTPLISWNDTRSRDFAKRLRETLDELSLHQTTGCRFHSSYWSAKIPWLLSINPRLEKQVKYWLSFGDYLFFRLFGEIVTSVSLASATGLFNRYNLKWNEELSQRLSIKPNQLPPISESPLSNLVSEFSSRWPQLANIPWHLAIGDGACNNLGSDCFDEKNFAIMVGTSGAIRVITREKNIALPSGLWSYSVENERKIVGGAISNAGNLFAWLKDTLNLPKESSSQSLEQALREIKTDSHNLTVLPFLSGERSLGWHNEAKAAILGLQLSSKPIEVLRAGLESIAYQFLLIYLEMIKTVGTPQKLIATGGGLYNSEILGEIIADVLGKELFVSPYSEASSRGAALLVLEKLNVLELKTSSFKKTYFPNLKNQEIYQKAFERYQKYYKKLIEEN